MAMQVENAKLLIETQLSYISKHQALREAEDQARQRLYDMETAFGGPRGPPRNRGPRPEGDQPPRQDRGGE
jgi:hypothetical protein